MIPITQFSGRDVAVFGLGRTGLSAAKALMAGGARVHAWDDNEVTRTKAEADGIPLSDLNKKDWQQFSALVMSPGIPLKHPEPHRIVKLARQTDIPIVGDMELFAMEVAALPDRSRPKIVGVTGTNGKSTTTALIGHILRKAGKDVRIGGNIGVGVLDTAPLHSNAVYVLELSSYQLDLVETLKCDVSVLLNITPDHLERHGGMAGYVQAKMRIFNNMDGQTSAVIGMDDGRCQLAAMKLAKPGGPKVVTISSEFALGRGVSAIEGRLFDSTTGRAIRMGDLRNAAALPGLHNHQNAAAAYATCRALGVDPSIIVDSILNFPGLSHRMELIGELNGIRFVNDSKATNVRAAAQALNSYDRIFWIAGGKPKGEPLDELSDHFSNIEKAYLIGDAQEGFAKALDGKLATKKCGTLRRALAEAVHDAANSGADNAVVLLSPACASFDQYADFEARGDAFRQLVDDLIREERLQLPA